LIVQVVINAFMIAEVRFPVCYISVFHTVLIPAVKNYIHHVVIVYVGYKYAQYFIG